MNASARWGFRLWLAALAVAWLPASGRAVDPGGSGPSWQAPSAQAVQEQVLGWLAERQPDAAIRAQAAELWPAAEQAAGAALLERAIRTFALADENVKKLVEVCTGPRSSPTLPEYAWLKDAKTPPLVARNVRLWYGRWLVHQTLYDEALEQLQGLRVEDVVDPASLLFYQGVVNLRLLNKDEGMEAIAKLMEGGEQGPRRYATLARLMEADLKNLKPDSLDHIARRMEDIERRLDLGRAGKKVRTIEDGVIASLDKLIKQLEDQQQQQSGAGGGSNIQPNSPASDSQIMGGKGRGEVTRKNIGNQSGWGNLPPKQREEALQQIGRDFPAHYRDVIEQYFRKLAAEGNEK